MTLYSRNQERAVYEAMAGYELKPGQALWLGPRSVAILAGVVEHEGGPLPDKQIVEKSEWNR